MKCDELEVETVVPQGSAITLQMYGKAEVDAAIDEEGHIADWSKTDFEDWVKAMTSSQED